MFDEEKTLCMRFFCLIILVRVGYVNYSYIIRAKSWSCQFKCLPLQKSCCTFAIMTLCRLVMQLCRFKKDRRQNNF